MIQKMSEKVHLKKLLRGNEVLDESDDCLICSSVVLSFTIIDWTRVLSRSRETKIGKYDDSSNIAEQHRLQSLQKAMAIQWLCFTPPSTIAEVEAICSKLLLRALMHR